MCMIKLIKYRYEEIEEARSMPTLGGPIDHAHARCYNKRLYADNIIRRSQIRTCSKSLVYNFIKLFCSLLKELYAIFMVRPIVGMQNFMKFFPTEILIGNLIESFMKV